MKMFFFFLSLVLVFCPAYSQKGKKIKYNNSELVKPLVRELDFIEQRSFPFQSIPDDARLKAIKQTEKMKYNADKQVMKMAEQPQWKNIGPFTVGGRVKTIAIHPTKDGYVYIGAAAGGIWLTTNNGANWNPIFDYENAISFGSICIDENNPDIIYAGTGEAVLGGNSYLGSGLYKSTDAGATWKVIGLTQLGSFCKVYVHPKNSNLIFAGGIKRGQGFYKSSDAGTTWFKTYEGPVTDISIDPKDENSLFIGVNGAGIFYSSDAGENWVQKSSGLPASGIGRISVQSAPSNTNTLYSLMEIDDIGTIFKSTDKGETWTQIFQGDATFFNGQGFYDNFISIHPSNENIVITGGIDVWKTISGGKVWSNTTNGYNGGTTHVDQHYCAFNKNNPNIVYLGNDGGMYKSTDAGSNWIEINNNLQITQFYAMAIDQEEEYRTIGGTQDNGSLSSTSFTSWGSFAGGDGFNVAIDFSNPKIIYGESTPGGTILPFRNNLTTGEFKYLYNGLISDDYSDIWNPPLVMDYNNNFVLYHGRHRIYASYNYGDGWASLKGPFTGRVTTIEPNKLNADVIYAGTGNGVVVVSKDGGSTWDEIQENGLVVRWVTDIFTSYKNESVAFITFSGYGTPHLFKTSNYGSTWENISTGLPDIPLNSVVCHPNNDDIIFVGSDIGVFATFNGGQTWLPFGRDLPRSPVVDLGFKMKNINNSLVLRAATHGRSIWEVEISDLAPTEPEITSPTGGELFTSSTNQIISWYGFDKPVKVEYSTDDGVIWNPIAESVQSNYLLWNVPDRSTIYARIRVSSMTNSAQVKISNTFTILLKEIGSVLQNGAVSYIPYGIAFDGKSGLWSTSFYTDSLYKLNSETFKKEKGFRLPGDSLFTDIAFDRTRGVMYIHKMKSTTAGIGYILEVDTNGTLIRQFDSPAQIYPIGLELVDGKLVVGDRDGSRKLWVYNLETNKEEYFVYNPFQKSYGPRCLTYDGSQFIYQVSTNFSSGSLDAAYVLKINKNDLAVEVTRMVLNSNDGIINARGIEYDPRDQNFWITDFSGNLYKIAGFETKVSVDENNVQSFQIIETSIYPNPLIDYTNISIKSFADNSNISVRLYNTLGQNIGTIFEGNMSLNEVKFVQLNKDRLGNGVYSVQFIVNDKIIETKQLIVIK